MSQEASSENEITGNSGINRCSKSREVSCQTASHCHGHCYELHEHLIANKILPLHGAEAKPFLNMVIQHNGDERFIVVIDSFANFADELGYNINDTRDVTKLFKDIRKITDKGHAIILVHHVTTNGKERGSEEYSAKIQGNAGAIFGRVDVTYVLRNRGLLVKDRSRISNAAEQFISPDTSILVQIGGNNDTCEVPK